MFNIILSGLRASCQEEFHGPVRSGSERETRCDLKEKRDYNGDRSGRLSEFKNGEEEEEEKKPAHEFFTSGE